MEVPLAQDGAQLLGELVAFVPADGRRVPERVGGVGRVAQLAVELFCGGGSRGGHSGTGR
ncbi:hypothetical protein ACFQ0T_32400 [Kitasatospora gansuensis]